MAQLVSRDGRARWDLGILSLLEIYPIAHGTRGSIFFLSGLSQLTGLHIESAIFLMNMGWAVLLCLSSFLLSRKIFKNNIIGLLTTFFIFTTGTTVNYLGWTASPRGFAHAIIPLVFLLMILSFEFEHRVIFRKKFFALFLILLFTSIVIHRLMYLFIPVVFAYFITVILYSLFKRKMLTLTFNVELINKKLFSVPRFLFYSSLIGIMFFFSLSFMSMIIGSPQFLTESSILSGDNYLVKMLNFGYHTSRAMRVAMLFSALGFLFIAFKRKNVHEFFLFIAICSFLPFAIRADYSSVVWVILLSPFAGYGFYVLGKKLLKKQNLKYAKYSFLIFLILTPLVVPPFVTVVEPWKPVRERKLHVEEIEVETAIYIKYNMQQDETFLTEPGWPAQIFTGKSGVNSMNMVGIEIAVVNETMRDNLEVNRTLDFALSIEFIERLHTSKGVIYRIQNDPLFPERYYSRRHRIRINERFMEDEYVTIVEAYNLSTIIIDEQFSGNYTYIQRLKGMEYVTYRNERFTFYPTPMPDAHG